MPYEVRRLRTPERPPAAAGTLASTSRPNSWPTSRRFGWEHINLTGEYPVARCPPTFNVKTLTVGFRPLPQTTRGFLRAELNRNRARVHPMMKRLDLIGNTAVHGRGRGTAGVERRMTAHSGRVGLASELTSRGASTTDVMLAGNWKTSRMVAHYSAGATAERGAVARLPVAADETRRGARMCQRWEGNRGRSAPGGRAR